MKKLFAIGIALLTLVSCKMDFYSSDSMTSAQIKDNPLAAVYTTDGIYALFKDNLPYKGQTSGEGGNMYVRHLFQLSETRSDNVTISGHSTDPFLGPYRYEDVDNTKNKYYFWWMGYKIIYAANSNIDVINPDESSDNAHLLGENYFFRALAHFHMVTLFAMPYSCGRDNPGVVLRRGMDYSTTSRATVGECYDAIVEDLLEAIKYMSKGKARGDKSYVSVTAAKALLSRVYLNMGMDQECIDICNELIGSAPGSVSGVYSVETLAEYPTHTWDSNETIWCIRHTYPTDLISAEATIGAMYYQQIGESENVGWGEWYWNDELIELFQRYPEDHRFAAYFTYEKSALVGDDKILISFPEKPEDGDFCVSGFAHSNKITANADGSYTFTTTGGVTYTAVPEMVNGYKRYFINKNLTGDASFWGGKTPAYIRKDVDDDLGVRSGLYVRYFNTKFSGQDGQATFTSPVILRWGEVFLNRAEAYAHLHNTTAALADVNTIRHRAGLSGDADFTEGNMAARGYTDVLDVVLDERRMELCFEGHRVFDIYRNKKKLDRRFVGYHPWEVIDYNDPRIALLIPDGEINVSGIPQNPR